MKKLITLFYLFLTVLFTAPLYAAQDEISTHEQMDIIIKLAEAGDRDAQYNVSKMFKDGIGVDKNLAQALKYAQLAEESMYVDDKGN